MAEPGGNPRARHIRPQGDGIMLGGRDPFGNESAGALARRIGSERPEIPQPREGMRGGAQHRRAAGVAPAAWLQRSHRIAHHELAFEQSRALGRVARPQISYRKRRRIRHTRQTQTRQARHGAPGVAQPTSGIRAAHDIIPSAAHRRIDQPWAYLRIQEAAKGMKPSRQRATSCTSAAIGAVHHAIVAEPVTKDERSSLPTRQLAGKTANQSRRYSVSAV
jgi:hypothetical protein